MGEEEYISENELWMKASPAEFIRMGTLSWNKRRNLNWDD